MEPITFTDNFYPEKKPKSQTIRRDIEIEYYFREELLHKVSGFTAPSRGDYVCLANHENLKVRSVVYYPERFLIIAYLVDPKDY